MLTLGLFSAVAFPIVPGARAAEVSPAVPTFTGVAVVVMENHEYDEIIGNPDAPYINSLAATYGLAAGYYAITHPSLADYLALTGGSTFGVTANCTLCHFADRNLADDLEAAGISWRAYMDGVTLPCSQSDSGTYVKRHDPFVYYDDIAGNAARCATHVVSASLLPVDMATGTLAKFVWLTPDLCHDMHDCSVASGDRYLAQTLPALLGALGPQGALFLTWDEGDTDNGCCGVAGGGHVATIIAGPAALRGARSSVAYDHYSLLRTIEDGWGLPALGQAAGAAPMSDLLGS